MNLPMQAFNDDHEQYEVDVVPDMPTIAPGLVDAAEQAAQAASLEEWGSREEALEADGLSE